MDSIAQLYSQESTIHGFQELGKLKSIGKFFWIGLMLATLAICTILLHELALDIYRDPRITSISELDSLEEISVTLKPTKFDYKVPHLNKLNTDEIYNITLHHARNNPPIMSYDIYSDEELQNESFLDKLLLMKDVRSLQKETQLRANEIELYRATDFILSDQTYLDYTWRLSYFARDIMANMPTLYPFSENVLYFEELIQKFQISHLDKVDDVLQFYASLLPDDLMERFEVEIEYDGSQNRQQLSSTTVFGVDGPRAVINIVNNKSPDDKQPPPANWYRGGGGRKMLMNFIFLCEENSTMSWELTLAPEYRLPDVIIEKSGDVYEVGCSEPAKQLLLEAKVKKISHHSRYCKEDLETTCITACMMRQARAKNLCAPFMGFPHLRQDIKFCSTKDSFNLTVMGEKETCYRRCDEENFWEFCSSIKLVTSDMTQQSGGYLPSLEIRLQAADEGLAHLHTEPKYTTSNILSSIGGVVGIAFGMSIMSVMQLFYYFCRACANRTCSIKPISPISTPATGNKSYRQWFEQKNNHFRSRGRR